MAELDDIYQIRTALEEGVRASFVAMGFKAFTRLNAPEQFQKERPRFEIKVSLGSATGRRHIFVNGTFKYDAWHFGLAIQAVTAPQGQAANNVLHEAYVGRLRNEMSAFAQQTWNDLANFPNHFIAEPLMDSGTVDTLKTEDGVEHSVLNYAGIICIRKAAWPNN